MKVNVWGSAGLRQWTQALFYRSLCLKLTEPQSTLSRKKNRTLLMKTATATVTKWPKIVPTTSHASEEKLCRAMTIILSSASFPCPVPDSLNRGVKSHLRSLPIWMQMIAALRGLTHFWSTRMLRRATSSKTNRRGLMLVTRWWTAWSPWWKACSRRN